MAGTDILIVSFSIRQKNLHVFHTFAVQSFYANRPLRSRRKERKESKRDYLCRRHANFVRIVTPATPYRLMYPIRPKKIFALFAPLRFNIFLLNRPLRSSLFELRPGKSLKTPRTQKKNYTRNQENIRGKNNENDKNRVSRDDTCYIKS